jgi:hypothetical protein
MGRGMNKVTYCCSECGSLDVLRDAWASWNAPRVPA